MFYLWITRNVVKDCLMVQLWVHKIVLQGPDISLNCWFLRVIETEVKQAYLPNQQTCTEWNPFSGSPYNFSSSKYDYEYWAALNNLWSIQWLQNGKKSIRLDYCTNALSLINCVANVKSVTAIHSQKKFAEKLIIVAKLASIKTK